MDPASIVEPLKTPFRNKKSGHFCLSGQNYQLEVLWSYIWPLKPLDEGAEGRTDGQTDGQTDGGTKWNHYPPSNSLALGIMTFHTEESRPHLQVSVSE